MAVMYCPVCVHVPVAHESACMHMWMYLHKYVVVVHKNGGESVVFGASHKKFS